MSNPHTRCQGHSNCNVCELRRDMVCGEVSFDGLVNFHVGIDDFDFDAGSALFHAGSASDAVYCLRRGAVKMEHLGSNGLARIVRVLKLGDVAGLESVFEPRYEYSAIAVGKVQACRIPMHYFHEFLGRYPNLQRRLIERSQAALRDAHTWLAQIVGGTTPVRIRFARLLLNLRIGDTDRMIRFSGDDMAAILGSTPETVSRAVSEFVRLGILHKTCGSKSNRVFRGDIAALEAIAREA